jgi:hypothetical protein
VKRCVLVQSCWKYEQIGASQAIRDTWKPALESAGVTVKFVVGDRESYEGLEIPSAHPGTLDHMSSWHRAENPIGAFPLADDVMIVEAPDGYFGSAWKRKKSLLWALGQECDWAFCCFPDTFIFPNRWLPFVPTPPCTGWKQSWYGIEFPQGGCGYFLDREGMEMFCRVPFETWSDDSHAGLALIRSGSTFYNETRFMSDPRDINRMVEHRSITLHLAGRSHEYDPSVVRRAWKQAQTLKRPDWDGRCAACGYFGNFRKGIRGDLHCKECRECFYL